MRRCRSFLLFIVIFSSVLAACSAAKPGGPALNAGSTLSVSASPSALPLESREAGITRMVTFTLTAALVNTPTPSASTPAPDPSTPVPTLPLEHYIRSISGHKQYFPLGCEAAAAKDWANYYGKDFNEFEFQYKLPLSDNPDLGFVGDVNAPWGQVPPYGYGVHAGPIADLLNVYDIPAKAYKGLTLEQVKQALAHDHPILAWVIGNVVGGVPYTYTDKAGSTVTVAAYEHVIILTGYNDTKIRYMNNGKFYETPYDVFLNSWGVLGNMAIIVPQE